MQDQGEKLEFYGRILLVLWDSGRRVEPILLAKVLARHRSIGTAGGARVGVVASR